MPMMSRIDERTKITGGRYLENWTWSAEIRSHMIDETAPRTPERSSRNGPISRRFLKARMPITVSMSMIPRTTPATRSKRKILIEHESIHCYSFLFEQPVLYALPSDDKEDGNGYQYDGNGPQKVRQFVQYKHGKYCSEEGFEIEQ